MASDIMVDLIWVFEEIRLYLWQNLFQSMILNFFWKL